MKPMRPKPCKGAAEGKGIEAKRKGIEAKRGNLGSQIPNKGRKMDRWRKVNEANIIIQKKDIRKGKYVRKGKGERVITKETRMKWEEREGKKRRYE